ncbi:uncharacterized protein LOC144037140 isoform X2 [Vanacampus margaritifer]
MKNKKRFPQSCVERRFSRDPQKAASSLTVPATSRRSSSALSPLDQAVTFVQHLCSWCCIDAISLKLTMPRNMADFLAMQPCELSSQIPLKLSDPLLCWAARSAPAGSQLHLLTTRRKQSSHTTCSCAFVCVKKK